MGEIIYNLDKYIEDFEVNNVASDSITVKELKKFCESTSKWNCVVADNYMCPFWRNHVGCTFRNKTPKEW